MSCYNRSTPLDNNVNFNLLTPYSKIKFFHKEFLNRLTYFYDLKAYYFEYKNFLGDYYAVYIQANTLNQVFDFYKYHKQLVINDFNILFNTHYLGYNKEIYIPVGLKFIKPDDVITVNNSVTNEKQNYLRIYKVEDII